MKPKLIIRPNGAKIWLLNGKLHRENGPAVELPDGPKVWYLNGQLYREDGPAIEWADGLISWYINGEELTKQQLISEKIKIDYPELYNSYLVYFIMGS